MTTREDISESKSVVGDNADKFDVEIYIKGLSIVVE